MFKLYGAPGGGSSIVELACEQANLTIDIEYLAWKDLDSQEEHYRKINPLGQIPALVTAEGTLLTETAAILTYIHNHSPESGVFPSQKNPRYLEFLRAFHMLYSTIYPSFAYADYPERWVSKSEAESFREKVKDYRCTAWLAVDALCEKTKGPFFTGERPCAVDWSLSVMTFWRPRQVWFKENAPNIMKIVDAVHATEIFKKISARNNNFES